MIDKIQLIQLQKVLIKAGEVAMDIYQSDFKVFEKQDASPLTQADLAVNSIVCNYLQTFAIPIISEENHQMSFSERKDWKQVFIIDPIDGTKEFVNKTDQWCICIALIEDKNPVFGMIYAPALGIMYYGGEGLGAYKMQYDLSNSTHIISETKLGGSKESEDYIFLHSVNYLDTVTQDYIENAQRLNPNFIPMAYGSALKFCKIAEGSADEYTRFSGLNEWDAAAGHAILKYSGINMVTHSGKQILYNTHDISIPPFSVKRQRTI